MDGEPVYKVGSSNDGTKGFIFSNPEAIGERVFVLDAKEGTTITTRFRIADTV